MMKGTFTLTGHELIATATMTSSPRTDITGLYRHQISYRLKWLLPVTAFFLAAPLLLFVVSFVINCAFQLPHDFSRMLMGAVLVCMAAYLLCGLVLAFFNHITKAPQHWSADERELHMSSAHRALNVPWNAFVRWSENDEILLVYTKPRIALILPKRIFASPDDLKQIHAWLAQAGVPCIAH